MFRLIFETYVEYKLVIGVYSRSGNSHITIFKWIVLDPRFLFFSTLFFCPGIIGSEFDFTESSKTMSVCVFYHIFTLTRSIGVINSIAA